MKNQTKQDIGIKEKSPMKKKKGQKSIWKIRLEEGKKKMV